MEKLSYGKSGVSLDLDRINQIDYLGRLRHTHAREEAIIQEALINTPLLLSNFIQKGCSVVIVVSDYTRPTGSHIYIPILLNQLKKLETGSVAILIALGLHRPATRLEMETICGGEIPEGVRIINHDPEHKLGKIGEAEFNQEAIDADMLIVTGAVTFHPMAGFSGGRKSLLPGIASSKDIYKNHKLYFSSGSVHKGVGPANIDNNPVLNDIREKTKGFEKLWALNVVLNEQNTIEFAACGEIDPVWENCRRYAAAHHCTCIKEKYDLVISSAGGHPLDHSFYQSMKVLTNSSLACKPGGTLVLISQCRHGWEIRDALFSYFTMTLEEISQDLQRSFSMDGLALYMALSIIRSHKVWLYSDLPEKEVKAAGMNYLTSLDKVYEVASAYENLSGIRAAVMRNGSSVLPINRAGLKRLL